LCGAKAEPKEQRRLFQNCSLSQRLIRTVPVCPGWRPTALEGWDDGFSMEASKAFGGYSHLPPWGAAPDTFQDPAPAVLLCVVTGMCRW